VSTNTFLWCETELCEERDLTGGTVTRRFFGQGEQISGTNYFFVRDHLGSIREMTDTNGTIQARYDYDPYGRRTKVQGGLAADFGFTGHYYHEASGLHLALYRAYDAESGRWLNPSQRYLKFCGDRLECC
jgi:RHS repeat-associated protein